MLLSPTDGFHHGTQIACKSRKHQPRQMHRKWVIDGLRVIQPELRNARLEARWDPSAIFPVSCSMDHLNADRQNARSAKREKRFRRSATGEKGV